MEDTMKKWTFSLVVLFLFCLAQSGFSQNTPLGFFVGASGSLLMMNAEAQYEGEDLEVTDDLFTMTSYEDPYGWEVSWTYGGLGWENKMLYGFKPILGYRFSPRFAAYGAYNYFLTKKSDQSDAFISQYTSYSLTMDASFEYSQRAIQLLGQFYPMANSGLFLVAGMEFVSLSAELSYNMVDTYYGANPWKADGNDNTSGFLFGAGFELPISSGNIALIGTVLFSTSNYNGDELLQVQTAPGVVTDPNIDLELNVGGIMFDAGLRIYFNKPQAL
jgi:hypothetical protein